MRTSTVFVNGSPPNALICGRGTLTISRATSPAMARVLATMLTPETDSQVYAVLQAGLVHNPKLVELMANGGWRGLACVLSEGEPTFREPSTYSFGFTLYVYDATKR